MVVLVDEEGSMSAHSAAGRRFRPAPPIAPVISGKDWEASQRDPRSRERRQLNAYDKDNERRGGPHANVPRAERDNYFAPSGRPTASSRRDSYHANQAERSAERSGRTAPPTPAAKSIRSAKSVTDASEFSFNIRDHR